ncbi:MAG: leucine-rich repeat protein, partial [Muribaculaceae bacterium]|nr:leucine-rich repeat protein [Muribaculaceae bacterium]
MRKILSTLIVLLTFSANVSAYDFMVGDLFYNICDDRKSVVLTASNQKHEFSGEIIIPKEIEYLGISYIVTGIDSHAFFGCTSLKSVKIPNSVTEIGSYAFSGCTGLTSVKIPNSVTVIGSDAFSNCTRLTSVELPNLVTSISHRVFLNCSCLKSIKIPKNIKEIYSSAFAGCAGLKSVNLPDSLTMIGESAFMNCNGLTSVSIPNSVTVIGSSAFSGCTGLTAVKISYSVTEIYPYVFYNCTRLASVEIPNSVKVINYYAFYGCSSLTSVAIPNSVTSIGGFTNCTGLTSLTMPDSVTIIGEKAFKGCSNLTSITIPSMVKSIGASAFSECSGLNTIYSKISEPKSVKYLNGTKVINESGVKLHKDYPDIIFSGINKDSCKIYVPKGSKAKYEDTFPWFCFKDDDIEEYDYGKIINSQAPLVTDNDFAQQSNYHQNNSNNELEQLLKNLDSTNVNDIIKTAYDYYGKGKYDKARMIFEAVIKMNNGKDSIDIADIHNRIGNCYYYKQKFDKAKNSYENAVAIYLKVLDNTNIYDYINKVIETYINLGHCNKIIKDYNKAIFYYKLASSFCKFDEYTFTGLKVDIGDCYFELQKINDAKEEKEEYINYAKEEYKEAINLFPKLNYNRNSRLNPNNLDYASLYIKIGNCDYANDDFSNALENYKNAWPYLKDWDIENNTGCSVTELLLFPKGSNIEYRYSPYRYNQLCEQLCKNIGLCRLTPDDYKSVYSIFKKTLDREHEGILEVLGTAIETERINYWSQKSDLFQTYYPALIIAQGNKLEGNMIGDLYNKSALFAKGLLLTSETELRRIILESDNENLRRQINKLQESNSNVDSKMLEAQLMAASSEYGDFMKPLKFTWDSVQIKLGDNDIAIEFLSFPKFGTDSIMYFALTVRPGYDQPHLIELCDENEIISAKEKAYSNSALSKLIWEPLAEELIEVDTIYFSPSGELHNIAIESMPHWSKQGVMMNDSIEGFNIYRLSSTRELAIEHTSVSFNSAAIFGDIDYNATVEDMVSHSHHSEGPSNDNNDNVAYILPSQEALIQIDNQDLAQNESSGRSYRIITNSDGTRGINWNYLKNTKDEVQEINSTLENNGFEVYYKTDLDATETSFKNLKGQKRRIIHIATHGFYWNDSIALQEIKETNPTFMRNYENLHNASDKAMVCAGLAFLGANNALSNKDTIPTNIDDGVLTAQEVSQLDLRGLELLVLSACQTGLGEIGGDGVFGLQRGFKKAGAQTIVMSLWKVNDEATKDMMTSFYTHLMEMGMEHKREA